jgi:hypothetical protein
MTFIRNAHAHEFEQVGRMLFDVYSNIEGFPKPIDQPGYYEMLLNVGDLTNKPETESCLQ